MNKVFLMGRLTRDPEVRYGGQDNSTAIARFSIAVDRRFRGAGDSAEADFFNCTAFGKTGEFVEKYIKKGIKIVVIGRLQNDNYTNQQGQKVFSTQIIVEEVHFAESKSASNNGGAQQYAQPAAAPVQNTNPQPEAQAAPASAPQQTASDDGFMNIPDEVSDDDLPFN